MRIMILDDDKDICELLKTALAGKGYEVSTFSDPSEVTFFHGNDCPCRPELACTDALIADIVMPTMEGIDLMRKLKENDCWPMNAGNVAIMSGYLTLHYMDELNELGVQYFRKPFDLEDIYKWAEVCEDRLNIALNS